MIFSVESVPSRVMSTCEQDLGSTDCGKARNPDILAQKWTFKVDYTARSSKQTKGYSV